MLKVYSIDGLTPVVDPTAFVHPSAVLIGDVIVGARCHVAACVTLRGDFGRIVIEEGARLEETSSVHGAPLADMCIGANAHIGSGSLLYGCRIGRNALVGINSTVLQDVVVGDDAIIAPMSLVTAGSKVPARHLASGVPALVVRELEADEAANRSRGTAVYQNNVVRAQRAMQATTPLLMPEPDRQRRPVRNVYPLPVFKR